METNKIYHLDCLSGMKLIDDNSIDLVITSPPYGDMKQYVDFKGVHPDKYVYDLISEIHKQTSFKMYDRLFWNKKKFIPNKYRFGDKIEYIFWFVKEKGFQFFMDEMRLEYSPVSINRMKYKLKTRYARTEENQDASDYKEWGPNPKGSLPSTLIDISSEVKRVSTKHVAVFPEKLIEYFVKGCTKENDIVLDIFMGSGTTGVVCKRLNRQWIGFEISDEYIIEANKRINQSI